MVDNINSKEAYNLLKKDKDAVLIDVRTKKEHLAVGVPNLKEIGKDLYNRVEKLCLTMVEKKLFK